MRLITLSGILHQQCAVEGLNQRVLLSDAASLVSQSQCRNLENFDINLLVNGFDFRNIYCALKRKVIKNENKTKV